MFSRPTRYTAKFIQKMFWSIVKYSNVDTNCARMYGYVFCNVDAICAEPNLRCHEAWIQNAPLALHRSRIFPRRPWHVEARFYVFKGNQRNTPVLNKAALKMLKAQSL
jgi:hypothetical protein